MLGHDAQSWKALEIDLMRVGVTSLAHHEYLLLVIEKASKFRLHSHSHPSKSTERLASHSSCALLSGSRK